MRTLPLLLLVALATAGCHGDPIPAPVGTRTSALTLPPILAQGGEGTLLLGGSTPFTVHGMETLEFTYTVGPAGLEAGGGFLLLDPILHGVAIIKYMDWVTDPADCNDQYAEGVDSTRYEGLAWAETDAASVNVVVDRPEHTDDMHQEVYTTITVDAPLAAGSAITLYLGMADETPLGPGSAFCHVRTPYKAFEQIHWQAASRTAEASPWAMLDADPPAMRIYGEQEIAATRVILPSFAELGETIPVKVALLDQYGNAVEGYSGSFVTQPNLDVDDLVANVPIAGTGHAVLDLEATPAEEGALRITVQGTDGIQGTSNPCVVTEELPEQRLYWGDIHAHHGVSYENAAGTHIDENLQYARDVAGLDFAAETMKLAPTEVHAEDLWQDLMTGCATYESDTFVPLLAFEWMGPGGSGHHNVYFDDCFGEITELDEIEDLDSTDGLYAFIEDVEDDNPGLRGISIAHASKYTGHGWDAIDDVYRPSAEVFSEWGDSLPGDGDRGVIDGLVLGNKLGFIASSDNHDGFMGNPMASKNTEGGLVAVLADELERDDVFDAIEQRATYGTSKMERIIVLFSTVEEGYRARMGEELIGFEPVFEIEVHGTNNLDTISLHRLYLGEEDDEVVKEWTFGANDRDAEIGFAPSDPDYDFEAPALFWVHVLQDGEAEAWTSPIWVHPDCDAEDVEDPAGLCVTTDDDDDDDSAADDDTADDDSADDDDTADDDSADDDTTDSPDDDDCSCRNEGSAVTPASGAVLVLATVLLGRRRR